MAALGGTLILPAPLALKADAKTPIYVRLSQDQFSAIVAAQNHVLIAEGSSPTLRVGEVVHPLEPIDDASAFDIVSSAGHRLQYVGSAAKRYAMRSELDGASHRLRERTLAAELERDAHRSIHLGTVGIDKRGRSVSPARDVIRRTASPVARAESAVRSRATPRLIAEQTIPSTHKQGVTRTLVADSPSPSSPPNAYVAAVARSGNEVAEHSMVTTSSGSSTSSSNDTTSTKRTSMSPSAKSLVPEVTVSSPAGSTSEPGTSSAGALAVTKSGARFSDADESGNPRALNRAQKAPGVMATTANGTRVSRPLRRSSSSGGSYKSKELRSTSPASPGAAPAALDRFRDDVATAEDGKTTFRRAALAAVAVQKRKSASSGGTNDDTSCLTPIASRSSTPAAAHKKRRTDPREEIWYTSSDEEKPASRSGKARGRSVKVKKLASQRVGELATDNDSLRPISGGIKTSSIDNMQISHEPKILPTTIRVRSLTEFLEMAARFDSDLAYYDSERRRLVELRADIQIALKSRCNVVERDGSLLHIGRGEVTKASKEARRRYDELSQVKAALQRWIVEHPR